MVLLSLAAVCLEPDAEDGIALIKTSRFHPDGGGELLMRMVGERKIRIRRGRG